MSADPNACSLTIGLYSIYVLYRRYKTQNDPRDKYRLLESPWRRTASPNAFKCMSTPRRVAPKSADPNARLLTISLYPIFVVFRRYKTQNDPETNIDFLSRHGDARPFPMLSIACLHLGEWPQSQLTRLRVC